MYGRNAADLASFCHFVEFYLQLGQIKRKHFSDDFLNVHSSFRVRACFIDDEMGQAGILKKIFEMVGNEFLDSFRQRCFLVDQQGWQGFGDLVIPKCVA